MDLNIGVLALQGAYAKHRHMLEKIGVQSTLVRYEHDLALCDGLILPGGESTTMHSLLEKIPLKKYAHQIPFFGTCAGMILMANEGILDITITRNHYGRQRQSFSAELSLLFEPQYNFHALFIRAPRIHKIHSSEIQILAALNEHPVFIQQGSHLACAFHPELTNDPRIHTYFIHLCRKKQSPLQQLKTTPIKSFQMT